MYRYCFREVNNLSVDPMFWHRNGLTLSYAFLG